MQKCPAARMTKAGRLTAQFRVYQQTKLALSLSIALIATRVFTNRDITTTPTPGLIGLQMASIHTHMPHRLLYTTTNTNCTSPLAEQQAIGHSTSTTDRTCATTPASLSVWRTHSAVSPHQRTMKMVMLRWRMVSSAVVVAARSSVAPMVVWV